MLLALTQALFVFPLPTEHEIAIVCDPVRKGKENILRKTCQLGFLDIYQMFPPNSSKAVLIEISSLLCTRKRSDVGVDPKFLIESQLYSFLQQSNFYEPEKILFDFAGRLQAVSYPTCLQASSRSSGPTSFTKEYCGKILTLTSTIPICFITRNLRFNSSGNDRHSWSISRSLS